MSTTISLGLLMGFVGYAYRAIQPPPPKICGSSNGPPITASRVKLSDGRHLAYKEHGVPKDEARYKIAYIHGFDSYRLNTIPLSPELAEELRIYMVSFDRPGYGESDPNPKRTEKGIALDVEELADQLSLGNKFYVLGFSMGGQATWGCLKYIPHRLAGATLVTPVINYWWPGFPADLSKEAYQKQFLQDQWTLRVAHYAPFLTYWWNTQKLFPASSVASKAPGIFSAQDLELLPKIPPVDKAQIRQQGEFESLHRDLNVGFGKWEFDPMDLENPFADNEGAVHLWHGDEDLLLPWIQYHELKGAGHLFPYADGMNDAIIKSLVLGKKK
ncbi:hypothetical protein MKW92_050626 [Papaver armeniacum]|nr:hypothetical protein MKW92_050626 [Papaver armeniacum]